jgi:hypothetical protein
MDLKELEKLMRLARKYGLKTVKTAEIEFTVDEPQSYPKAIAQGKVAIPSFGQITEDDLVKTPDALSPEDLLFYSATGQPTEQQ